MASPQDIYKERTPIVVGETALPYTHRFHRSDIYVDDDGNRFYESWVGKPIPASPDDRFVEVPTGSKGRLDVMSFNAYGTSKLRWILALANDIADVHSEVLPGRLIRIPTIPSLRQIGFLSIRAT